MAEIAVYKSEVKPDWCPGCGDFGVLTAVAKSASELNLDPKDILVVSGIGCSSNFPGFFNSYGFHGIHGRSIPFATGAKLSNHDLNVVVTGGYGDGYGIGIGHFIHAMRRNLNITYIVMNNGTYGLTTGQTSPTSKRGYKTKSTPQGSIEDPINPIPLSLISGATYVARGFSGDPSGMSNLITKGIDHKGFSLIDVFSPCVTYNKVNTYDFYRERTYKLLDTDHDPSNFNNAIEKSFELDEKIPIGLFYQKNSPTYEDEEPVLKSGSLLNRKKSNLDSSIALEEFY